MKRTGGYDLKAAASDTVEAPRLAYQPRDPKRYHPGIGLIACGGITAHHLAAYRDAGYRVLALCDPVVSRAEARRTEFFPEAEVYADHRDLLGRDDIEVVDIATHPPLRPPLIEDAIAAGKHVLSQKPFVVDLAVGERLADLADARGVKLAVNQNGRWAPHFSYIRQAIQAGLLGDIISAHLAVHWNHGWIQGTEFEKIHHVVLYDFAIHWFDIVTQFFGDRAAKTVFATTARAAGQSVRPPLLGQAVVEYEDAQASLVFDAGVPFGAEDHTYVAGTLGTIVSTGPDLGHQRLTLYTSAGAASPALEGAWFDEGFHGTMGELLCAIEEDREPSNAARKNLKSLALCFAAVASADEGVPKTPGEVRELPASWHY